MSRARENANISPAAGRNMVINGAMNVAQRSASVTGIGAAAGYFTCDRWQVNMGGTDGRLTMTQTADGPNGISANCIKLDCTTADTSIAAGEFLVLRQYFEGQNLQRIGKGVAGAKQITVSFYVKASAAFDFVCELQDNDHGRQLSKLFSTTTGWVRHEFTYAADVDDGSSPFDDDTAKSLTLSFWLHAGATYAGGTLNTATFANNTQANRAAGIDSFFSSTDNNFFVTGVQMEVGPVATEFEQEDISTTLAKCQRYYYQLTSEGTATNYILGSVESATAAAMGGLAFPSEMRAIPTAALLGTNITKFYSAATGTDVSVAISTNRCSKSIGAFIIGSFTGATVGQSASLYNGGSGSGISFDAEL